MNYDSLPLHYINNKHYKYIQILFIQIPLATLKQVILEIKGSVWQRYKRVLFLYKN